MFRFFFFSVLVGMNMKILCEQYSHIGHAFLAACDAFTSMNCTYFYKLPYFPVKSRSTVLGPIFTLQKYMFSKSFFFSPLQGVSWAA